MVLLITIQTQKENLKIEIDVSYTLSPERRRKKYVYQGRVCTKGANNLHIQNFYTFLNSLKYCTCDMIMGKTSLQQKWQTFEPFKTICEDFNRPSIFPVTK